MQTRGSFVLTGIVCVAALAATPALAGEPGAPPDSSVAAPAPGWLLTPDGAENLSLLTTLATLGSGGVVAISQKGKQPALTFALFAAGLTITPDLGRFAGGDGWRGAGRVATRLGIAVAGTFAASLAGFAVVGGCPPDAVCNQGTSDRMVGGILALTGAAVLAHLVWDIATTERDLTEKRKAPALAISVGPVQKGEAVAPGLLLAGRF